MSADHIPPGTKPTGTSNTCKRYTQPVIQAQPGPTFKMAEVPLFEDPKGKWVKWEDYERLRADRDEAKRAVAMWQAVHGNKPTADETGGVDPKLLPCTACGNRPIDAEHCAVCYPPGACEWCEVGIPRSKDGSRHESIYGVWACRASLKQPYVHYTV